MDIDVRLLRSFVKIFERGSLSRAADELACTQAAMSMRLKLLETELGEPLFLRHHHKLEPTFRGTEFYPKALTVLAAYDEMISSTRNKIHRSKVRVGVPDDYALGFLPNALRSARQEALNFEIEVICDLSANLAAALSRNEIDIALVTLAAQPTNALATVDVHLNWVFDQNYRERPGAPVQLVAYPEGCVFRRAMIETLDQAGMPWAVMAQSRNRAGIVASLRGNIGVTAMAVGTVPHGLREVPESDWLPKLPSVKVCLLGAVNMNSPEMEFLARAIRSALVRHTDSLLHTP